MTTTTTTTKRQHANRYEESSTRYLRGLVQGFLAHPGELEIHAAMAGRNVLVIECQATRTDTPRLVGSKGAMIRAVRTVMHYWCAVVGVRLHLNILEPKESAAAVIRPFRPNLTWDAQDDAKAKAVLEAIIDPLAQPGEVMVKVMEASTVFWITHKVPQEVVEAVATVMDAWGRNNGRAIIVTAAL